MDTYVEQIVDNEAQGDVMRAMELFTEVRVLQLDLPPHATEAGIRTFARGGQWQRAADMYEALPPGHEPADETLEQLFDALAEGRAAGRALALLQLLQANGCTRQAAAVSNRVVRTCARSGELQAAEDLLSSMQDSGMHIDRRTYEAVASAAMKQGRPDLAELCLEMRDYL